ncbi:hypothetical protein NKH70_24605 [Mesorhizobium sp. M0991]
MILPEHERRAAVQTELANHPIRRIVAPRRPTHRTKRPLRAGLDPGSASSGTSGSAGHFPGQFASADIDLQRMQNELWHRQCPVAGLSKLDEVLLRLAGDMRIFCFLLFH